MDPAVTSAQVDQTAVLASLLGGGTFLFVYSIVLLILIISQWKIFTKANEAGWQSIIPVWNIMVLLKIVGRPMWWVLLFFVPIVNLVIIIIMYNDLSKSFAHGMGYTLGLLFLPVIFFPMLAFGSSTYRGVASAGAAPVAPAVPAPAAAGDQPPVV